MEPALRTERLVIRPWRPEDAESAMDIYGATDVTRWLTPAMDRIDDPATMRRVLEAWREDQYNMPAPRGRWAVERLEDGVVVGGLGIRLLPPYEEDLELSWQLSPKEWGHGYATEAGRELIRWAFTQEIDELFAVSRPGNKRAISTAERLGLKWVGETEKYYDLKLQVYRVRPADLA